MATQPREIRGAGAPVSATRQLAARRCYRSGSGGLANVTGASQEGEPGTGEWEAAEKRPKVVFSASSHDPSAESMCRVAGVV